MGVTINVKALDKFEGKIKGIARRIENPQPCYIRIGSYISSFNRKQFATNGAYAGSPWKPLKPYYLQWKISHGYSKSTLVRTGKMRASYTARPMRIERYGKYGATFGTNVRYAHFHETGTRYMPKRVVMKVTKEFRRDINEIVFNYITGKKISVRGLL